MAEKILMSEYKALSKEPWTNIEVSAIRPHDLHTTTGKALIETLACQREHLRVDRSAHRRQPGVVLLRRLLQGQDDLSKGLSVPPSWLDHI